jgi:TfoX/Sxy family transcriptional regulator of competence genes
MVYDEGMAERIRDAIAKAGKTVEEKKMFGGLSFLLGGHMAIGVLNDDVIARVPPAENARWLAKPGARPFDFTGRAMAGWLFVGTSALESDAALEEWVAVGLAFASSQPAKAAKGGNAAKGGAARRTAGKAGKARKAH